MSLPQPTIEAHVEAGTLVIRVSGYLNSRIGAEVGKVVDSLLDSGGRSVLLNFEGTRMMNSVGISSITSIVDRMSALEGRAAFCSLAGMNQEIFRTMGATRGVRLFDTEAEALVWFGSDE